MKRRSKNPPDVSDSPGLFPWKGLRWGAESSEQGYVVVEAPLEIAVGEHLVAVLMYTPGLERELAVGYCLDEGLVSSRADIALVEIGEGADAPVRVTLRLQPPLELDEAQIRQPRFVRSGCGANVPGAFGCTLPTLGEGFHLDATVLEGSVKSLASAQEAYRIAGGIHATGVFAADGASLVVCEDIGRHNALDKALGYCALHDIALDDKFLVATGRASYELVTKSVRLGVPIVASLSSPTSLALQLADVLNQTLIGYLRPKRFVIYTHPWRVRGE